MPGIIARHSRRRKIGVPVRSPGNVGVEAALKGAWAELLSFRENPAAVVPAGFCAFSPRIWERPWKLDLEAARGSAILHGHKITFLGPEIDLARSGDPLFLVGGHLLPMGQPADCTADGE